MAQDTTATSQQLAADPQFQAYLARVQQYVQQLKDPSNKNKADVLQQLNLLQAQADDYAKSHGMPNGYTWDFNTNQVVQEDFARRHPYLTALGLGGAAVAAPIAFGTIGVGGAGGAGASAPELSAALPGAEGGAAAGGAGAAGAAGAGGGIFDFLKKYGSDIGGVLTNAAASDRNASLLAAGQNARAIAENNAAKVAAAKYNLELPSVRASQTARGEVLNTMQNAPLTGDPRIDKFAGGGLRPSAFGPNARAAGALESSTALNALQNPSTDRLTPQEIPPFQSSGLDNALGGMGLGADIFSLLSKYGGSSNGSSNPNAGTNQTGAPIYDANGNLVGYGG